MEDSITMGCTHLQLGQMFRALLHVHSTQANANGTGRDNADTMSIFPQLYRCVDDERENRQQRLMCLFIDN
jgi:hypothetical protein